MKMFEKVDEIARAYERTYTHTYYRFDICSLVTTLL